jgi:uncharacterized protein involved in response to NO
MTPHIPLEEPGQAPLQRFALWQLGFRPFYLLASVFASLSIGLWALQFSGLLGRPYLKGSIWHAHEMLFGFILAVIVGFLFTAGRNWSNQPTPKGFSLVVLVLIWAAARVLVLTPYGWAAAAVNTAFPLVAAIVLGRAFSAGRNRRNYFFVALLLLMSAATLTVHLNQLGAIRFPGWLGIQIGLDVVLFIMSVMAGRVMPMFTNNGVPGAKAASHALVEKAALGLTLALLAADTLQLGGMALILLIGACAAAHLIRWALWRPWKTTRAPIVWILHVAYLWIPLHLLLRGLFQAGWVMPSAAVHALTVGAAGGLIIGMMTRTARGHTGRPLQADLSDVTCYLLVTGAAMVRVFLPLAAPAWTVQAVLFSAALWSTGFGLFAIRYWPVLTRPRLDGKSG